MLVMGNLNDRSSSLWSDAIDTIERTWFASITSYYGLHQIINEPTHILQVSASCIDFIFTNQPKSPPPDKICSNQFKSILSLI